MLTCAVDIVDCNAVYVVAVDFVLVCMVCFQRTGCLVIFCG